MMPKRLAIALLVSLAPSSMPASGGEKAARPASPVPKPEFTPAEVVEIQLAALQFNDRPAKDAGIATAFKFASPGNRRATGPLERFTELVKTPAYRPLIDHRIAGFGISIVEGGRALRRVTVVANDGRAVEYEFRLTKDPDSGCWFTDGVVPIPEDRPINPGKVARNAQPTPSSRS